MLPISPIYLKFQRLGTLISGRALAGVAGNLMKKSSQGAVKRTSGKTSG